MDRAAWRATVLGVAKSWAQMKDFQFSSLPKTLSLGFNSVPMYRGAEISVTPPSHSPQKLTISSSCHFHSHLSFPALGEH